MRGWAAYGTKWPKKGIWRDPEVIIISKLVHLLNEGWHVGQKRDGQSDKSKDLVIYNCAQRAKQYRAPECSLGYHRYAPLLERGRERERDLGYRQQAIGNGQ